MRGVKKKKRVKTLEDCFLPEYRKVDANGCWIWQGSLDPYGYPFFRRNRRNISVTRFVFEQVNRKMLGSLNACHSCDNPPCFNPDHLFAGTFKANMEDKVKKGRALWSVRKRRVDATNQVSYQSTVG